MNNFTWLLFLCLFTLSAFGQDKQDTLVDYKVFLKNVPQSDISDNIRLRLADTAGNEYTSKTPIVQDIPVNKTYLVQIDLLHYLSVSKKVFIDHEFVMDTIGMEKIPVSYTEHLFLYLDNLLLEESQLKVIESFIEGGKDTGQIDIKINISKEEWFIFLEIVAAINKKMFHIYMKEGVKVKYCLSFLNESSTRPYILITIQ